MTFVRCLLLILLVSLAPFSFGAKTTLLVMGDSLSAGYGLQPDEGWVHLLQQSLAQKNGVTIINASVSGETSSGGLTRLPALLSAHHPNVVVIELGGNDGLRGQPLKILQENLQSMITASKDTGAKVLLIGMQIPPNYGARYTREFQAVYPALAKKNQIPLVPFLLEGVATHAELMQNDSIHANAKGQPILLNNVLPLLKPLLE